MAHAEHEVYIRPWSSEPFVSHCHQGLYCGIEENSIKCL